MAIFAGRVEGSDWVDNFECAHSCVADIAAAFKADGVIVVDLLKTRRGDDPGERVIVSRRPAIINNRRYSCIETPLLRFVEEVDDYDRALAQLDRLKAEVAS